MKFQMIILMKKKQVKSYFKIFFICSKNIPWGGSPASKSYMWAKPKVSVFKNGQFRDPFFLRKIFFFGKKQKLFSPLTDNFCLFFFFNIFSIFFEFFFYGHFFCFSDTFFGGIFLKKK